MASYTPGPWGISNASEYPPEEMSVGPEDSDEVVCWINDGVEPDDVVEANARLIAAAPELLAACKMLLSCSLPRDVSGMRMVDAALAAIAKAEGTK